MLGLSPLPIACQRPCTSTIFALMRKTNAHESRQAHTFGGRSETGRLGSGSLSPVQ
jgi:hypothetical protein